MFWVICATNRIRQHLWQPWYEFPYETTNMIFDSNMQIEQFLLGELFSVGQNYLQILQVWDGRCYYAYSVQHTLTLERKLEPLAYFTQEIGSNMVLSSEVNLQLPQQLYIITTHITSTLFYSLHFQLWFQKLHNTVYTVCLSILTFKNYCKHRTRMHGTRTSKNNMHSSTTCTQ